MKYTIRMSCGHEDTVDLDGKTKERERKIEYFKSSGLCKDCYKKKMEEEAASQPLTFNFSVRPFVNEENGKIELNVWFSGNTRPYKDSIKALGYKWGYREFTEDFLGLGRPPMCWSLVIELDDLPKEAERAANIGAKCLKSAKSLATDMFYRMALKSQAEWNEKNARVKEIPKPQVPDVLAGHRWNRTIYGRAGNYSVYLDDEKVVISDEKKEEIEKYLNDKEEYQRKVKEIRKSYT